MALSILDGNQSATTLSTILSSGQHITAHTVVSLGTQAITDIVNATSAGLTNTQLRASAVTIGGTVTVGNSITIGQITSLQGQNLLGSQGVFSTLRIRDTEGSYGEPVGSGTNTYNLPVYGTVTVGNSVTIGSLPAISGTVTANVFGQNQTNFFQEPIPVDNYANTRANAENDLIVPVQITNDSGTLNASNPLPISGTVTANLNNVGGGYFTLYDLLLGEQIPVVASLASGLEQIGSVTASLSAGTNRIGVVTIGGGTVTIGAGTAQIGSVTASISNSVTIASFATSVTARLINPAGTAVTYAEVGTAGNPSIDVLSIQGVTSGTPINVYPQQGTTVSNTNFTSTTASTTLVSAVALRESLTVFNEGAGNLFISPGATCTTVAYQVRLSAGDYWECPQGQLSLLHSAVFATAGTARVCQVS
jgi:hypothetical protein